MATEKESEGEYPNLIALNSHKFRVDFYSAEGDMNPVLRISLDEIEVGVGGAMIPDVVLKPKQSWSAGHLLAYLLRTNPEVQEVLKKHGFQIIDMR